MPQRTLAYVSLVQCVPLYSDMNSSRSIRGQDVLLLVVINPIDIYCVGDLSRLLQDRAVLTDIFLSTSAVM